jgi:hypothetical protein
MSNPISRDELNAKKQDESLYKFTFKSFQWHYFYGPFAQDQLTSGNSILENYHQWLESQIIDSIKSMCHILLDYTFSKLKWLLQ